MTPTRTRFDADLYQLTMAAAYLKAGTADREAVFSLFFRKPPVGGRWAIAAGIEDAASWLASFRIIAGDDDRAWLATLTGASGSRLFETEALDALRARDFACDVDAVPEGTIVFPHEPILRVRGPVLQAQLVETALLALVNFPTLVATKAARVVEAAQGRPVLEFGLRRAQGLEAGLIASRAAWIGGVAATSNLAAGRAFGIPVRGTHAHSWVLLHADERAAFAAFADAYPDDASLLVDTFDTHEGVRNAIDLMRARGRAVTAIRLDSGDLLALSKDSRRMLDAAGFPQVKIVASNDLDEREIARLVAAGAPIDAFGVGTRLVTGAPDAALGGVYKLTAVREGDGWRDCVKVSDDPAKSTLPGILQVRRFPGGDVVYDEASVRPAGGEDLLVPLFRGGKRVRNGEPLDVIRARVRAQHAGMAPGFSVTLEPGLAERARRYGRAS